MDEDFELENKEVSLNQFRLKIFSKQCTKSF
jgi:hypothetical protein